MLRLYYFLRQRLFGLWQTDSDGLKVSPAVDLYNIIKNVFLKDKAKHRMVFLFFHMNLPRKDKLNYRYKKYKNPPLHMKQNELFTQNMLM